MILQQKQYRVSRPIRSLLYLAATVAFFAWFSWLMRNQAQRDAALRAQQDAALAVLARANAEQGLALKQESQEQAHKALFAAVQQGDAKAAAAALDAGANVNATDTNTVLTALQLCFEDGTDSRKTPSENVELLRVLLDHGADPNVVNQYEQTPLMRAVEAGYIESVKLLLQRGADVNRQDKERQTALMCAANGSNLRAMSLLLTYHANVNLTDDNNMTVLDLVQQGPQTDTRRAMERLLRQAAPAHRSDSVFWVFHYKEGKEGEDRPQGNVYLKVNGHLILIERETREVYRVTSRNDYELHEVPASALTACWSWYAGGGWQMYVIRRGNNLKVYRRGEDCGEEETDKYHLYRTVSIP